MTHSEIIKLKITNTFTKAELAAIATPNTALAKIAKEFPYAVAQIRIDSDNYKWVMGESEDGSRSYASAIPDYNPDWGKI